jgi:hypothetical protein
VGSLLRWSYRIGFLIAGIAAIIFLVAYARSVTLTDRIAEADRLIRLAETERLTAPDFRSGIQAFMSSSEARLEGLDDLLRNYDEAKSDEERQRIRKVLEADLKMQQALTVQQKPWGDATVVISGVTCLATTIGAFSGMFIAWRLDRRQTKEAALRFAQLQAEVERSRQVKVDQS